MESADRYEEMLKRLRMEQVKPQFVSDTSSELLDEQLPPEPAPIQEEVVQVEPEREPASLPQDRDMTGVYGDLAVAAGPALQNLLFGGTYAEQAGRTAKANEYLANRGKAYAADIKDLKSIVGANGKPEYLRASLAEGREPFYQTKAAALKQLQGKEFQPATIKNILTGEVETAKVTGKGYESLKDGVIRGPEWVRFMPDDIIRSRSAEGGYQAEARDKATGKLKPVTYKPGLGDVMGGVSREEAALALKGTEKGKQAAVKAIEASEGAKRAMTILEDPNLTPEKAAQGIFYVVKATNGERLSDTDYANLRGSEFKSYLRQVEDWASGRLSGTPNPKAIQAYREIARDMFTSKISEAKKLQELFTPKGTLPQKGQEKLERASRGTPGTEKQSDWRKKLKGEQ